MSNFSTAFGYDVYIVPLAAAEVDTSFTGVTSAATFASITTPVAASAVVSYASGVFTVAGAAFDMDGADTAVRLAGLTNAALETDTNSEDVVTYDDETKGCLLYTSPSPRDS